MIKEETNMTKEEIKKKLNELEKKINKMFNESCNMPDGWNWYRTRPEHEEAAKLRREYKLLLEGKDIKYSPIENIGDKMTLNDFAGCCRTGGFIDDDGFGYYATEDKETDITIYPSDIMSGVYRKDFTHVVWYNR